MFTILICTLASIGAGLGTGFAGMSAAVVISPMLVTFLNIDVHEAIGIALASDVLASAASAYTYKKNNNIDLKNSKYLFSSVLFFTFIGAIISNILPETTMGNFTVYVTIILGIIFIFKKNKDNNKNPKEFKGCLKILVPTLCGALIGFLCGFVGAGGGMAMLIILTTILGYELKKAVGTSVFIMTFTALFGSISHFALATIFPNVFILILCMIITFISAIMASKFANKAKPDTLNKLVGIVLTLLGLVMLLFN